MKPFKQEKLFYSIAEVAEMFDVNASLLRYWEKEFTTIRPHKSDKGTRQYRKEDIESIRRIHHLVKEKGLTLAGAKERLKTDESKGSGIETGEIVFRLKNVRAELLALKQEFDELERQMPDV
jgi:DNA-binding transcriptional MerR regulator